MERYGVYNIPLTEAEFAAGVDALPKIKESLRNAFSNRLKFPFSPLVFSVLAVSDSNFTVTFNDETTFDAVTVNGKRFVMDYDGPIGKMVFEKDATLTFLQVEWGIA